MTIIVTKNEFEELNFNGLQILDGGRDLNGNGDFWKPIGISIFFRGAVAGSVVDGVLKFF